MPWVASKGDGGRTADALARGKAQLCDRYSCHGPAINCLMTIQIQLLQKAPSRQVLAAAGISFGDGGGGYPSKAACAGSP